MERKVIDVDVLKLKEAIAVVEDDNATEEEVAAALIVVDKLANKLATYKHKLSDKIKNINASKQMELEIVYSNPEGDGVGVLSDTIEYVSVDMVGVHKDAGANISVTYSDTVYEQLFKPVVRCKKSEVIRLANEGVLPNASKRVKKMTVEQVKLFDYKEPDKD